MSHIPIHGFISPGFEHVYDVFKDNFITYGDIGASFCVYYHGECIIDLYGGYHDNKVNPPIIWNNNTISNVYSCTKAMANMCILLLIQENKISFNTPISKIWNDFGQNGKENITIEQLLTHQGGLTTFGSYSLSGEELQTWTNYLQGQIQSHPLYNILIKQQPNWNIGDNNFGYHPLSIGFYLSEIVKRVDSKGRSVQQFWMEEFAKPLDIDFYIGLPQDFDCSRLARLISTPTLEDGSPKSKNDKDYTITLSSSLPITKIDKEYINPPIPLEIKETLPQMISKSFTLVKKFSPWKTRYCELPSGIGFGNAKALSKVFGLLACSANNNELSEQIIKPNIAKKALERSVEGYDLTLLSHRAFSRCGYHLSDNYPNAFFHFGNGGALVFGDIKHEIGLAYTPSHLLIGATHNHGARGEKLVKAVYYCLNNSLNLSKIHQSKI